MPIRREDRGFYPIDWPQLSAVIRFERAKGRCERCGRPHGRLVLHLGDGRWWDQEAATWRDGEGRGLGPDTSLDGVRPRLTRVYLATAHREHDTSRNGPADLAAWCQRCHLDNDRPEHQRRRRVTLFRRRAVGDLFLGFYPAPRPPPVKAAKPRARALVAGDGAARPGSSRRRPAPLRPSP